MLGVLKSVFAPGRVQRWVTEGCRAVEALVFPWECAVCSAPAEGSPFCDDCRGELMRVAASPACWRCAMPVGPWADQDRGCSECRGRSLGFDSATALGLYEGPIRELCLKMKNERNAWLAPWLAGVLAEARAGVFAEVPADAVVVAVPLHWRRQWQRGYNQASALARGLARRLSLRMASPLCRVRATPHLARAGRTERAGLLQGAFAVRRRGARGVEGRTVLLVDDILTTGATCGSAARVLKQAGARRVVAVVVGRAEGVPR